MRALASAGSVFGVERIAAVDAHEGPVYVAEEHALYFTSVPRPGPRVDIRRLDLDSGEDTVVRADANAANGMALALDGRLVVCEQDPGALALVDRRTGEREPLVGGLNSPNDVAVRSDGSVWFTDPSYGHLQGFRPPPARPDAVYRYDPRSGSLELLTTALDKPNGICFSPGETTLYVADSGANHEPGTFDPARPHHVKAFDVVLGRRLERERVLWVTEPGFPDGLKCDGEGRVYASSFAGIQIFSPAGEALGEIALPGAVNFCFGGARGDVLYVCADSAVFAVSLPSRGA